MGIKKLLKAMRKFASLTVGWENNQLPVRMEPSKKVYETLGFKFDKKSSDGIKQNATLPSGWTIESIDFVNIIINKIFDEQGHLRGGFSYGKELSGEAPSMKLFTRLDVLTHSPKSNPFKTTYYFGEPGEDGAKLFVAGTIIWPSIANKKLGETQEEKQDRKQRELELLDKSVELEILARDFGKKHYPDYEDVTAYWDLVLRPKKINSIEKVLKKEDEGKKEG